MKTIKVVAAVICDNMKEKNKIFATARGYGELKGGWEFPGGKIEAGETPQEALKREIMEELDTEIKVGDLIDTIEYGYPTFHLSMDCFWAEVTAGHLELKEAVTNISHDLRTPLTAIYGYLNLLKKEECPEHIKRYLDAIENRAQALKQLTEELFRYTIVISEAEEMTLQVLTLNGILESSISAYYSVLKQNHIVPEISISDQQITGRVNENALSRVLGNILSNAVKYSDGDLKIVLSEDGEIRISNHASGLSEVQAERLFDRFYTVNTARKSTGLGLSIAKALMEKMGGTITADYRENVLEICVNVQKL